MLNGIQKFLQMINDQWVTICVILGLICSLYVKIKDYMNKTTEERIAVAKTQIRETILKLISDAEVDYEAWNKAGSIKRAQVVQIVYEKWPILNKAISQEDMIKWIDQEIDNSLKTLREIVKENIKTEKVTTN